MQARTRPSPNLESVRCVETILVNSPIPTVNAKYIELGATSALP
jgi:hypothetical protein